MFNRPFLCSQLGFLSLLESLDLLPVITVTVTFLLAPFFQSSNICLIQQLQQQQKEGMLISSHNSFIVSLGIKLRSLTILMKGTVVYHCKRKVGIYINCLILGRGTLWEGLVICVVLNCSVCLSDLSALKFYGPQLFVL